MLQRALPGLTVCSATCTPSALASPPAARSCKLSCVLDPLRPLPPSTSPAPRLVVLCAEIQDLLPFTHASLFSACAAANMQSTLVRKHATQHVHPSWTCCARRCRTLAALHAHRTPHRPRSSKHASTLFCTCNTAQHAHSVQRNTKTHAVRPDAGLLLHVTHAEFCNICAAANTYNMACAP
eukprot:1139146-Pelagomonas_calceolata.AAC.5